MTANIHKLVRKKNEMFHKVYNKKQTYAYSVYKQFRNSLNTLRAGVRYIRTLISA